MATTQAKRPKGLSRENLYQIYAYTHRYDARCSVLLYPRSQIDLPVEVYVLLGTTGAGAEMEKRVHVRFIDLNRDLRRSRKVLAKEFQSMIREVFHLDANKEAFGNSV